jgi:hypothetical protein
MSTPRFELGLTAEDERAMREARRLPIEIDREAVIRLIKDVSALVDAAVRQRPLLRGKPFTLPGHEDDPTRNREDPALP